MKIKEIEASFDYESEDTAESHKLRVNHLLRELQGKLYAEEKLPNHFAIDVKIHRHPRVERGNVVSKSKTLVITAHLPQE